MARSHSRPWSVAGLCCLAAWLSGPAAVVAQTRPPARPDPPPSGQRLEARDGDIVIVEDDARVQLVNRKQGVGRTVYDAQRGWVMVLLDANSRTSAPDGKVDWSYRFAGVSGEWPLGERWEGPVVVDQYRPAGTGPSAMGIVVEAAGFTISFLTGPDRQLREATHHLRHKSGGNTMTPGLTFDAAEQRLAAELARDAADPSGAVVSRTTLPPGTITTSTSMVATQTTRSSPGQLTGGVAPVRVGGSIAAPRKMRDAAPIYPETARATGATGSVILEIVVDAAGAVVSASPLSGHALLINAAVDAAKQWRYEPTIVDNQAVPVVMTVAVPVR